MARTITLKYPAVCAECHADLAVGSQAAYYGRGRVYGRTCHADPGAEVKSARRTSGRARPSFGRVSVFRGPCEDAPCCGCCGPQGDGSSGY